MFVLVNPNSQRIGSHDIVRELHNIGKKSRDTTIEQEVCALKVVIRSSTKFQFHALSAEKEGTACALLHK